jgi:uncharacterized RDD family membrane protein YckC
MKSIGLFKRLLIIIYDGLLLVGVLFVGGFVLSAALSLVTGAYEGNFFATWIKRLYWVVMPAAFYVWFWTNGGQTLGMKTWNVYLVDDAGKFINRKTAIKRYCVALVSWATLGSGFLWSIFDRQNRTWHDIATQTHLLRHKPKAETTKK